MSIRWGERANHSCIAARLEASSSGDFQSPFVNGWAISNRPSLVHVIPAPEITLAFSDSSWMTRAKSNAILTTNARPADKRFYFRGCPDAAQRTGGSQMPPDARAQL